MLSWIGVALLAVSWLFGLSYYHQANWPAWGVMVLAGTFLLARDAGRMPPRKESAWALLLAVPAVFLAPWPFRAAILLIVVGLGIHLLPLRRRYTQRLGAAGLLAGTVLLAQSLAILAYTAFTSRSHELPAPLPRVIGAVASLLGIDVAVHDSTLALFSMRETHMLGATWELLLDPATLCFAVAAAVLVSWRIWATVPCGERWRPWARSMAVLVILAALWLPVRAALLMAGYLHGILRTEYEAPLDSVKLFWNSWVHLLLLAGPVLLAWRLAPLGSLGQLEGPPPPPKKWRRPLAAALAFAAVVFLTAAVVWDPVGQRQAGRVVVEEYHPDRDKIWEPSFKPFDTEWYGHLSGYNYYCIYDYCSRFYSMSRLNEPIDDAALEACDVLVIKVPTRPYSKAEIESVRRFVEAGGGLLLIGEHTNVFGSGTYLNSIARTFGFTFRYDCLFGIDSVFDERYDPPLVPHPVTQHMPPLDFATSCSIDPGKTSGRAVIRAAGLKNAMADYHVDNFYPQPDDTAEMRYGAFVQLWSMRYGRGRVLAFSDSTIFSNFSTFEPGKSELMLGMLEWLNHRNRLGDPRPWLAAAGVLLLLGGLLAARAWDGAWLVLTASGLLGWAVAAVGIGAVQRSQQWGMPPPPQVRPMVEVVMDRTICDAKLPKNGFIAGKDDGFGIFERWILRLGYFTSRRRGADVFDGNLVVFLHPHMPVPDGFREQLVEYVASGGKVLVIDSPDNPSSTTGDLLQPFGLSVGPPVDGGGQLIPPTKVSKSTLVGPPIDGGGQLKTPEGWPPVPVRSASTIAGGRPFAWLGEKPVAASVRHGKGSVTLLGFGSRFVDLRMGVTGDVVPEDDLKQVFELEYSLLRAIVEGRSLGK